MTNVARAGGGTAAGLTFVGDLAKGLVPVLIARAILGTVPPALALVGFAAFVGASLRFFYDLRADAAWPPRSGYGLDWRPHPF